MDDDLLIDEEPLIDNESILDEEPIIDDEQSIQDEPLQNLSNSNDLLDNLLQRVGIKDRNNISYLDDDDNEVSRKWEDFSLQEQIEILTHQDEPETGLDIDEINFINTIRNSKMSPIEYGNYLKQQGVNEYLANFQEEYKPTSQVDDIEDDVLFITDIIQKVGSENVTDEELKEMLENAKANPALYEKQVRAIRNEWKQLEISDQQARMDYEKQQQLEQYNQFAEHVENSIRNFTSIADMPIDMSEDEMEDLYNFIVGFDEAGTNIFSKALKNPDSLVRMAWFAMNGEQALKDLDEVFSQTLKKAKNESYKKGLEDAKKPKSSVYINNRNRRSIDDDIDLV